MHARCFEIGMAVLLLLAGGADSALAQPAPKSESPKPLPKEIVAAWQKAGARPGWLGTSGPGGTGLKATGFLAFEEKATGLTGTVPAFRFDVWKDGVVAKLPVPATPFGLDLRGVNVKYADLKELAGLKSLHTLSLGYTGVTDADLKELARLKNLHTLHLVGTFVTGPGLNELASLKGLHSLNLGRTKMTDGDLNELAGLKSLRTLYLDGTKVTDAGVAKLQMALPDCKISR